MSNTFLYLNKAYIIILLLMHMAEYESKTPELALLITNNCFTDIQQNLNYPVCYGFEEPACIHHILVSNGSKVCIL